MGIVLAVTNQKGGVGKTTTAVNLAASLAVAERRVLLIDMDPQGNATSGVGVRASAEPRSCGTYGVLLGALPLSAAVAPTDLEMLFVVAATRDLAAAELDLAGEPDRIARLRDALREVRDRYDYIILDCPPSLGLLTLNALVAADAALVPLQCEYYALEGLSHLADTIERVRASWNPELHVQGVVLTMYDARCALSRQVAEEVRKYFPVYDSIIPRNVRLAEAPSHGKPVLLYDAGSRGSHSYLSLAREVLDGTAAHAA